MIYKTFKVNWAVQIDGEINAQIERGYEFVQVIVENGLNGNEGYYILMRIAEENTPTYKLAQTLTKTIENIKADPTSEYSKAVMSVLCDLKTSLGKTTDNINK